MFKFWHVTNCSSQITRNTTKSLNANMDLINIHLFENHAKYSGMLTKPPKDQNKKKLLRKAPKEKSRSDNLKRECSLRPN